MRVDHYESGSLYGVRYEMERGEELPKHLHPQDEFHNICVLRGSVTFWSKEQLTILRAGEVFDFDGTQTHLISALENAVILNLYLFGKPRSLMNLTESEKHFTV